MNSWSGRPAHARGPTLSLGVIDEARRRHLRRRRAVLLTAAALAAAGAAVAANDSPRLPARSITIVAPAALLAKPPTLSVACELGTPSCDRIGVYVVLRHRAVSVRAVLDGHAVTLAGAGRARVFAGYISDARLVNVLERTRSVTPITVPARSPLARLQLAVRLPDGGEITTALDAMLGPVYG